MRYWLFALTVVLAVGLLGGAAVAESASPIVSARYLADGEACGALADIVLDSEGPRILIEFNRDVYGFELAFGGEIDMDSFLFTQTDSLYRAGVVRAGESVCVRAYIPDTIPNLRISFVTERGDIAELLITDSGEDGSVMLIDAPRGEVSASEAEGLLIARFSEADAVTGNTYSWGLTDEIELDGVAYYQFRVSWLVIDEGGGGHMSYLCDMLVSKVDGAILISDDAGGWTRAQLNASSGDEWAIDKAHIVSQRMARLASEEAYLKLFTAGDYVLDAALRAGELSGKPLARALVIDMPEDDNLSTLIKIFGGTEYALSDEAMRELSMRLPHSIAGMLSAWLGAEQAAAASLVSVSDVYIAPEGFKSQVIVLDYGADIYSVTSLARAGEGFAVASATPLPAEALAALDELKAAIGVYGETREYAY